MVRPIRPRHPTRAREGSGKPRRRQARSTVLRLVREPRLPVARAESQRWGLAVSSDGVPEEFRKPSATGASVVRAQVVSDIAGKVIAASDVDAVDVADQISGRRFIARCRAPAVSLQPFERKGGGSRKTGGP
jgi:hypothetical protein